MRFMSKKERDEYNEKAKEYAGTLKAAGADGRNGDRLRPASFRQQMMQGPKGVNRNAGCGCGSGRKWKKCCGRPTVLPVDGEHFTTTAYTAGLMVTEAGGAMRKPLPDEGDVEVLAPTAVSLFEKGVEKAPTAGERARLNLRWYYWCPSVPGWVRSAFQGV